MIGRKKLNLNNNKSTILTVINNMDDKCEYIKPIIKWVGGKTQIVDKVINKFPKKITNYHEIFLGGGSILFALLQNINNGKIKLTGNINAYDINETLINLYKNIQKNPGDVLIEIRKIIDIYNTLKGNTINKKPKDITEGIASQESYFYWIRSEFNKLTQEQRNTPIGTAYFIFLNKTCFRGLYREGPNGFNVPFGHYIHPEIINDEHIIAVSNLIKNVNFVCASFEYSFKNIKNNDFLYLDPPYAPVNEKSFVGYTFNGFTLVQHQQLFTMCKQHKFLMSNANVDLVVNNFKEEKYTIEIISCKRSINSKKPASQADEVLITSY